MVRKHLEDIFRFDSIRILEQNNKVLLIPLQKEKPEFLKNRLIKGIVIDEKSRKPLPYANVFLINKSIGVVSNNAGRFELKIDPSDVSDTLGVSYMGYKMEAVPLDMLDSTLLVVRLSVEKINLKEVVIKPLDPIYIITKAIEKIPENYDRKPAVYTGFYRESTRQDKKNISLSEAIVDIYKEPYTSQRPDQIKIFKGRNGSNTDSKDFVDFIVQGSLYNILQLDIIKNLPTFLDPDYFALYKYSLERVINHLERSTYVITFDQREGVRYPCYRGKVYIDVKSLAIVGSSFELNERGMSNSSGVYVRKTPRWIGAKPVNALYQVYYRNYHGKWNLSNSRSEINIRVKRKGDKTQDKFNSIFASISEFVVTEKDTINIARFKIDEVARPKDVLTKQLVETEVEFWGEENIIIPEEPIEKAIIRIGHRNNIFTDQEIDAIKIEEKKDEGSFQNIEETEVKTGKPEISDE
jgi:hypothetical protein